MEADAGRDRRAGEAGHEADYDLVRRLRASICVLGPLLARCGQVRVAHPGRRRDRLARAGHARVRPAADGRRHLQRARLRHRQAPNELHGATIWLDFPSVGATENLLMAAVLADGHHRDRQRRPRAGDRRHLPDADRHGRADLRRRHVARSRSRASPSCTRSSTATIGDRIVAGTWAFGAAMTRGDVTVHGVDWRTLEIALDKVTTAGGAVSTRRRLVPRTDGATARARSTW